jgi:hypothetical protein
MIVFESEIITMKGYSSDTYCSSISYSYTLEDDTSLPSFITFSGRNIDIAPDDQNQKGDYSIKCRGTIAGFGSFVVDIFEVEISEFVYVPPALPVVEEIKNTTTIVEDVFIPEFIIPEYIPIDDEEPLDCEIKEITEIA